MRTAGERLLDWFRATRRELPWRGPFPRDPYRVLVSEVMLQQTQVERVVPRFEAFLRRFPDLESLAAADEEQVLEAFSGLGYYRRARSLHSAARALARAPHLPTRRRELERLPGIGPYTAAAVSAFAFGGGDPPVDGNVARVAARVESLALALGAPALLREGDRLARRLHADAPTPETWEALMELGARVCTPRSPACDTCPLRTDCAAAADGNQERLPLPRRSRPQEDHLWVSLWLPGPKRAVLFRRVPEGVPLAGLWLPPFAPVAPGADPAATARGLLDAVGSRGALTPTAPVLHGITHRRITVLPFVVAVSQPRTRVGEPRDGLAWADPSRPGLPTSSLTDKLRRVVELHMEAAARAADD